VLRTRCCGCGVDLKNNELQAEDQATSCSCSCVPLDTTSCQWPTFFSSSVIVNCVFLFFFKYFYCVVAFWYVHSSSWASSGSQPSNRFHRRWVLFTSLGYKLKWTNFLLQFMAKLRQCRCQMYPS